MARILPGLFLFVSGGLMALTGACQQRPVGHAEAMLDEGAGVRIASLICLQAAQNREIEVFTSCFAADASMLAPGEPVLRGREEARDFWSKRLANRGYSSSWQYSKLEAENAGDLSYEIGAYEMILADQKGKLVASKGKFLLVWKRSRPGQWKIAAFMLSAD
jgi:ketosteroid isomerase-like protein